MGSSITQAPSANETHNTPPADRFPVKAITDAEAMNFAPAYLAGYFGSAIEQAAAKYPNDRDLRCAAALYQAWMDRAYDARATIAGGAK